MIRTLYWRFWLHCDEAYLAQLQAEGWSGERLQALQHSCEALRVKIATAPPLPDPDRVVMVACGFAAVVLGGMMLWHLLARIAN